MSPKAILSCMVYEGAGNGSGDWCYIQYTQDGRNEREELLIEARKMGCLSPLSEKKRFSRSHRITQKQLRRLVSCSTGVLLAQLEAFIDFEE
jgi:hypothetical protein